MLKITEKILLHQVKNGHSAAFSRLYDFYLDKIYRFIYFRVSDEHLAKDLTNDTFVRALDYLKQDQVIDNFQAFLYQTARNLLNDFYRQKDEAVVSFNELIETNITTEKNLDKITDEKFELEKIQKALNQIPEPYREIIILRFVEDLPFKEIGKITGQTENYSRTVASRGLKLLREKLG